MKKTLLILLASSVLILIGASIISNDQADATYQKSVQHLNHYTPADIEGNWTMIRIETIAEKQSLSRFKEDGGDPEIAREWSPPVYINGEGILSPDSYNFYSISNSDLDISGDSIFWLNYPIELERRSSFTIESDILTIENSPDARQVVLSPNKDTLTLSYLGEYGLYIEETYEKVSFKDSLINILKLHTSNLPLFAGKWVVMREYDYDYGTHYTLDFPYEIPDSIMLTREELLNTLNGDSSYYMMTDGTKRKYFLTYYEGQFFLKPDNWCDPDSWRPHYTPGTFSIGLEQVSKERQQLSPQACWVEFLQVITAGNKHNTIDLMTAQGYDHLRENVNPLEMEITLKRWGRAWQELEIEWEKISNTHAIAKLGPESKEKHLEFVKVNGLWKIDVFIHG